MFDAREAGAVLHRVEQRVKLRFVALCDDLYAAAVLVVAHPAGEAARQRFAPHEFTEPDALYATADSRV